MTVETSETKKFTGFHATVIIVSFFAVVVCVNLVMARFAVSSFGGTVVDNSYVASQKYNQWLEQARQQQAHGWTVTPAVRSEDRLVVAMTDATGAALENAAIVMIAEHPVGRTDSLTIPFEETRSGTYRSAISVPEGRWKLRISITHQDKTMALRQEIS